MVLVLLIHPSNKSREYRDCRERQNLICSFLCARNDGIHRVHATVVVDGIVVGKLVGMVVGHDEGTAVGGSESVGIGVLGICVGASDVVGGMVEGGICGEINLGIHVSPETVQHIKIWSVPFKC